MLGLVKSHKACSVFAAGKHEKAFTIRAPAVRLKLKGVIQMLHFATNASPFAESVYEVGFKSLRSRRKGGLEGEFGLRTVEKGAVGNCHVPGTGPAKRGPQVGVQLQEAGGAPKAPNPTRSTPTREYVACNCYNGSKFTGPDSWDGPSWPFEVRWTIRCGPYSRRTVLRSTRRIYRF